MGKLFREYKWRTLISSGIVLLPMAAGLLLWRQLPESMLLHWGADDGQGGLWEKVFLVFGIPLINLAVHFFCLVIVVADPKYASQSKKAAGMAFWTCPAASVMVGMISYSISLGWKFRGDMAITVLMAALFMSMGNYLPKLQQNTTMGIKVPWALWNEENWNRTHRFAGRLWFWGGAALLPCLFLPGAWYVFFLMGDIFLLALAPVVYSYCFYRSQVKAGTFQGKSIAIPVSVKRGGAAGLGFGAAILVFVLVMLFTGNIRYQLGQSALVIQADYHTDMTLAYEKMDSLEFREDRVPGLRSAGFGSPRLLMGTFENEEFGYYTRYTYTGQDASIVIRSGSKVLVLSCQTREETWELYQQLLEKQ